ncbi:MULTISPECIES: 50S ribosomal protein L29 [unclassified Siphonobacter]|uniref:50S ribosomal protein L29 n=1 Tax=unclassified Siphonobacter TaxID=2635712 RepID=UPI000CA6682F|nr:MULTISPECIES: 50S ribosomal protein L29 [unclassified Siphonobacter]MDQ1087421.1 large subunit ribosomal protein L29 [Siphonobacter sp. SORGH_AS_1065]MDR6193577.1 large subunit ribosomal protein L29 [Siphonobacter sp. SORGH_AS_0500]PKK36430.1 50S ribosomal protein L29 [Siphonobacter sp. SORGH_AS_0500]
MKIQDIRALSTEDLRQQIAQEKEALSRLQFAHAISPIENPMRIRTSRKLIARMTTELNAR